MDNPITRYDSDEIIDYNDEKVHEIRDIIDTSIVEGDVIYSAKSGDTLKDIANKFYNDARYYWVIAEFNDIIDPFKSIEVGTRLRLPTLRRIRTEIV